MNRIISYQQVPKNWNGRPNYEDKQFRSRNGACTGKDGGIYNIHFNSRKECFASCAACDLTLINDKRRKPKKLQTSIEHEIQTKKNESPKKLPFNRNQKTVESLKNLTCDEFHRRLEFAVENNLLSIESCCGNYFKKTVHSLTDCSPDPTICFSYSHLARQVPVKPVSKSIKGLKAEERPAETEKWPKRGTHNFKCICAKADNEKCQNFGGTHQFNCLGRFLQKFTDGGLNYISADLDDLDSASGHKVLARSYAIKMKEMKQKYFFLHMTLVIKPNEAHTIVGQIFVKEKIAVVIDPDEMRVQFESKKTKSCEWLNTPLGEEKIKPKDRIREFIERFGIKTVRFGTNGNGLDNNNQLFMQFEWTCNVTVTLGLFFAGLGFPIIPRFPKDLERALFCRLKRFYLENSTKADFPVALRKYNGLDREELIKIIENFVKS